MGRDAQAWVGLEKHGVTSSGTAVDLQGYSACRKLRKLSFTLLKQHRGWFLGEKVTVISMHVLLVCRSLSFVGITDGKLGHRAYLRNT